MTIIYKKEPRKPGNKPRTASLAYQAFQDARALAFMQTSLSSDGLFAASSKALGKAIGASQPTAIRVIRRLISEKRVHLVRAATDKFGKPVTDALGRQVPNQIFPWRRPDPSVNTGQLNLNKGYSPTGHGQTESPYSSVNACIDSNTTYSQQSVGYKSLDVGNVYMYSSVNTAPPKWAVERQVSAARPRLGELEAKLKDLLQQDKNVTNVDSEICKLKTYIADLETWAQDGNGIVYL
jgi:hypothetical protein